MVSLFPHDPTHFAPDHVPGRLLPLIRGVQGPKPFGTVAVIGDSQVTFRKVSASWEADFMGYFHVLTRQQVDTKLNGADPYFATAGAPIQTVHATHLAAAIASGADGIVVGPATNNYNYGGGSSDTPAQTAAHVMALVDAILAAGKTPIVLNILPVPSGFATRSAWIAATNLLIDAELAARPRAIAVDVFGALDSNRDGVTDNDNLFSDTLHWDSDGASRAGAAMATACAPYIIPRDIYDGIVWRSPNPTMTGGGTVATGWAVDPGSGKSVVNSLIPRGGALGNWQQIVMSGTATNSTILRYGFGATPAQGGFADGDVVEFVLEYETDSDISAACRLVAALQTAENGGSLNPPKKYDMFTGTPTNLLRVPAGVMRTAQYTLVVTTNFVWPVVNIAGTGTVRIGRCGFRKVA